MQVQVERCAGHLGVGMPVRFRFDGREIEIVEIVDQWYGPNYCYFKIKGNDGNLYILRFDEGRAEWELTMFQSPGASATTSDGPDQSRTPRNEFHAGVRAAMIKISSGAPRGLSSHPRFGERRRH